MTSEVKKELVFHKLDRLSTLSTLCPFNYNYEMKSELELLTQQRADMLPNLPYFPCSASPSNQLHAGRDIIISETDKGLLHLLLSASC